MYIGTPIIDKGVPMRKSLFFFITFFSPVVFAQTADVEFEEKTEQEDMDALRRWIRDKRLVTVKEIGGDLSLSGQVRFEFQMAGEERNGIRQRGHNAATRAPARSYDVEVNLMLDYRTDRSWAAIKLEYDNTMGTQTGTVNRIALEKAYLGGRVIAGDTFSWDFEVGRRYLNNVFDSKVEFGSLFDGALLRFSKATQDIGDFYTNAGVLVINEKKDHYAYVAEFGFLHLFNTGTYAKLSYINWKKTFKKNPPNLRYNYRVSQLQLGYQSTPSWLRHKLLKLYAAVLYNDAADKLPLTNFERQNIGWYTGFSIGQVRKEGDWALDTNFQWMQAQVVPDFDAAGIGRGNAARVGTYTTNINGSGAPTTNQTSVGSGNFYGWQMELLYAFTSNLTVLQNLKMSWTLDENIGPNLKFKQAEIELIYAF
jgi:hypothetical protein